MGDYFEERRKELQKLRQRSLLNKDEYWSHAAEKLTWSKKWDQVLDLSDAPITKWFTGGEINMCYNCLDKPIQEGYGETEILIFDSPVTETRNVYTYNQIHDEVIRLAGLLEELGIRKGDLVMIYMPMILQGAFAMLATCRLGAVHCCMPSGLPAQDLAVRIDHAKPKVILVATAGYHANGWVDYKAIVDDALEKATHKPKNLLVWKRPQLKVTTVEGRDIDWQASVEKAKPKVDCVPMESNEPLFIIYTSGSTGEPKAIVHAVGPFSAKMISDFTIIIGADVSDDVYYMTTNLGWIVSHIFLVYGPTIKRLKAIFFEGDPLLSSDPNALYKLIQENKITQTLVRPGVLKLLRQMDPDGQVASRYSLDSLRQMYYGGEKTDTSTLEWTAKIFNANLFNVYGQTELGGYISAAMCHGSATERQRIAFATSMFPGFDVVIMTPDNTEAKPNEMGRILVRLPLPPGSIVSLFGDHQKCKTSYFSEYPGFFDTKDEGYLDENGDLFVCCRADDMMKHASVYLAAQAVEEVVLTHPDVAECVVISTPHLILKEVPVTLYIVNNETNKEMVTVSSEILEKLSAHFGEAVTFGKAIAVKELPRTRTGKIHRPSVRAMGKGELPQATGAVENPEVLEEISYALKISGYGRQED